MRKTSELLRLAKDRYEQGNRWQIDSAGYAIHTVSRNATEEVAARKFLHLANPTEVQRFDRAIELARKAEEAIEIAEGASMKELPGFPDAPQEVSDGP